MREPHLLLWSHVVVTFVLAAYLKRDALRGEPDGATASAAEAKSRAWVWWLAARTVAAGALTYGIASHGLLAAVVVLTIVILGVARRITPAKWSAEVEIGAATSTAMLAAWLISSADLKVVHAVLSLSFSNQRISAACLVVALLLFTVHGGTYIVRGILNKTGAIPRAATAAEPEHVDVQEFNRGRLIGALERVLLFAVVLAGSYEALGFVIAAKGLVRSRELETSRDMTEYFLIGSLSSVLVALATGTLARYVMQTYW